jgi:hypothetical protein
MKGYLRIINPYIIPQRVYEMIPKPVQGLLNGL